MYIACVVCNAGRVHRGPGPRVPRGMPGRVAGAPLLPGARRRRRRLVPAGHRVRARARRRARLLRQREVSGEQRARTHTTSPIPNHCLSTTYALPHHSKCVSV